MSQNLFVGIPLSYNAKVKLEAFQQLHHELESVRWIAPENFHVTVCFLGKGMDLENMRKHFAACAPQFSGFTLPFHSYCLMPERKPSMVWARFEASELYVELYENLHRALLKQYPARRPIPHVTLARFKKKITSDQFQLDGQLSEPIGVNHLTLWQTIPIKGGVRYRPIETISLRESGQ